MIKELEIIFCIPGKWKVHSDIVSSIASANSNEYIFAGNLLLHIPTSDVFEMEICDYDSRMKKSFEFAGQGRLNEIELSSIENHNFVIYIIGKGGSEINGEKTMKAGQAILNAGGLGIKVETSGKAFSKRQWEKIINFGNSEKFYETFVVILRNENNSVYSCGLHNIGLRDIICDQNLDIEQAVDLIKIFIYYQLIDKPSIKSGETFSKEAGSPVFRITEEDCIIYDPDDLFFNPFGMYRLKLI